MAMSTAALAAALIPRLDAPMSDPILSALTHAQAILARYVEPGL
jgi:hypothetical protein